MSEGVATLRRHMKPEDETLLDQLADVNTQRANLFVQAQHAKIPAEQYFSQKAQLEVQAQELEKTISSRSAEFLAKSQPITLERVQQTIPKDSALIEYFRYRPFNPKARKEEDKFAPARYIAYVLKSTGEPQSIELGDAAEIDHLVHDWRKTLANGRNPSVAALARKLDEKIMRPVRKLLGETRSVLISPDGALNLIPFAALKDEHDRYLVERIALTYLSSGRDLLRFDSKIDSQQPATLLADVDFGKVGNKTKSVPSDRSVTHRRAGDYQGEFQPLPGTKAEAQAISKILPAATILTGQQASESKLKQLDRPHILHIATHGFFLSDLPDNIAKARGVSLMGSSQIDLPRKNNPLFNENPLLRSGLALANANRLESGEDDGVLTAMEAANLDLWGTQLVVLSACETGVGEVQNGQGVFGLRRALVIAGSESQVMSLWKVDDDGTKELMVDYYQRLLNSEGRSEAMRQTQLAMLASDNRNHPFYWASFIVSGDWKPMEKK
ncbi:MAG: CHAT domain-containing protein [Nitrosomonas sp.]